MDDVKVTMDPRRPNECWPDNMWMELVPSMIDAVGYDEWEYERLLSERRRSVTKQIIAGLKIFRGLVPANMDRVEGRREIYFDHLFYKTTGHRRIGGVVLQSNVTYLGVMMMDKESERPGEFLGFIEQKGSLTPRSLRPMTTDFATEVIANMSDIDSQSFVDESLPSICDTSEYRHLFEMANEVALMCRC